MFHHTNLAKKKRKTLDLLKLVTYVRDHSAALLCKVEEGKEFLVLKDNLKSLVLKKQ